MSNNFVFPFQRYTYETEDGKVEYLNAGIFREMLQRHKDLGGDSERGWQPEIFKIMLDGLVCEAGVDVLFHARMIDTVMNGRNIESIKVSCKSGILNIKSRFFVDASGDGELFASAGCDYQIGRESDNLCQPMTTCFRISNIYFREFAEEQPYLQALYKEKRITGEITNPRENILLCGGVANGILHFNTTRIVKHNPVDPIDIAVLRWKHASNSGTL